MRFESQIVQPDRIPRLQLCPPVQYLRLARRNIQWEKYRKGKLLFHPRGPQGFLEGLHLRRVHVRIVPALQHSRPSYGCNRTVLKEMNPSWLQQSNSWDWNYRNTTIV